MQQLLNSQLVYMNGLSGMQSLHADGISGFPQRANWGDEDDGAQTMVNENIANGDFDEERESAFWAL
eukprot:463319-Alexandrium_andersonii.AAC.1